MNFKKRATITTLSVASTSQLILSYIYSKAYLLIKLTRLKLPVKPNTFALKAKDKILVSPIGIVQIIPLLLNFYSICSPGLGVIGLL
jgi:hypothetical protein